MTEKSRASLVKAEAAAARIRELQDVFDSIKAVLMAQVQMINLDDLKATKPLLTKLGELQSAQVILLKAEEAFHDKYGTDDGDDAIDHDVIRIEIGRRLDRVRHARGTNAIPEGADAGAGADLTLSV